MGTVLRGARAADPPPVVQGVDDVADAAPDVRRPALPCGGLSTPAGKVPGLAKPQIAPCDDLGQALQQQAKQAREQFAAVDCKLRRGGRNVATAHIEINGQPPRDVISVSGADGIEGTVPTPTERVFDTIVDDFPRDFDTEAKILEDIAQQNGAQRGQVYPGVTGRIDLYTENVPCRSCQGVIQQFREMYPNIEVNVYYGRKTVDVWKP